jgi:toxin FitB
MAWLLDTDILSESSKQAPSEKVLAWIDAHDASLHLSTISLGEMVKGIALLPSGAKRARIEDWFARLERWAGPRLLAPDAAVMRAWGLLCARHEKKGRRLPVLDSLIAATALAHGLTVVTRNTRDYPPETPVLNPFGRG